MAQSKKKLAVVLSAEQQMESLKNLASKNEAKGVTLKIAEKYPAGIMELARAGTLVLEGGKYYLNGFQPSALLENEMLAFIKSSDVVLEKVLLGKGKKASASQNIA